MQPRVKTDLFVGLLKILVICSLGLGLAQQTNVLKGNSSTGAAAQKNSSDYASLFEAMVKLPEGRIIRTAYFNTFQGMSSSGTRNLFNDLLNIAQNLTAPATLFWPDDGAWDALSSQLCMSVDKILETLSSAPSVAAQFMRLAIVPNITVMSDQFQDGEKLATMEPGFELLLTKRTVDGKAQWYFPKYALNETDVTITRSDIKAGAAVIHFTNTAIFNNEQRTFWYQQKKNVGQQACEAFQQNATGGIIGTSGDGSSSTADAGMIAGIVVAAVAAAGALAVVVYLLTRKQPLRQRLSGAFGVSASKKNEGAMVGLEGPYPCDSGDRSHGGLEEGTAAMGHIVTKPQEGHAYGTTGMHMLGAAAPQGVPQPPLTPSTTAQLPRTVSGTAGSDASISTSASQLCGYEKDESFMAPVFEANPAVAEEQLSMWLLLSAGRERAAGSIGDSGGSSQTDSSGSGGRGAVFAEQLRKELNVQSGNPNIISNYTNFTREVEHSTTAVYFCDGMHNNRQFALKFYARPADFDMEMQAYKLLGGPHSKYVPTLEMSYPGNAAFPTSVLVFERGQCTLETFARQRPSYFQQIDIFHQLVSAVQHLHERGVVHRDMKPSNVVHFPEKFAWKLIDLATIARIGEDTKIVYTREYCSPEVAQAVVSGASSMVVNPASDLWGIGIIMYELAAGQRYFPQEWSMDGGRRIWSSLCGFEALPSELADITAYKGVDRGVMKLVRRLLQRDPSLRPTPRQLLAERIFQARGNTTTQISQGSNVSHGSTGSGHLGVVYQEP